MSLTEACAAAVPEVGVLAGTGATHRRLARFGPLVAVDQGVGTSWSVQLHDWVGSATDADRRAALAWCAERGGGVGWLVTVPDAARATPWVAAGMVEADRLPMLAISPTGAAALDQATPPELEVGPPLDRDELVAAYGGWMDDVGLAAGLVTVDDLSRPERAFLVGRVSGRPVGCALVWFAAGTSYLSGIGVVADHRGRGYGGALTRLAARLGGARTQNGSPPQAVWMTASDEGLPVYTKLGFSPVGEEVRLRPAV